jgi:segregation and condensation protein B
MPLEQLIEAILFWKAEPVSIRKLAEACGHSEGQIQDALTKLEEALKSRGLVLMRKPARTTDAVQSGGDDEVLLGTAPEASELIEKLAKEELSRDLGKAGLETLSIVLYKGPITRAEIDYIRGVNSSFILRNLQIRDLVEKIADPSDARRFLYRPTFNLLQHLGVTKAEELPEYGTLIDELTKLTENKQNDN